MSTSAHVQPSEDDDGDAIYLEQTLRHAPTDLLLDDSAGKGVVRDTWRRSVRLSITLLVVFILFWLFNGGLAGASSSRGSSSSSGGGSTLLAIGFILAILAFVGTWVVFLFREQQEAVSEWCTVLAGKAWAAESVYSHIAGRLRDRQLPMQYNVHRRATSFGTANRLVMVDGNYWVFVSAFRYGTGLYLGWTMWRIRKGTVLLADVNRANRTDFVGSVMNEERLKAMRETVHAVCREALHTAIRNVNVAENYGFPGGMPAIEGLPYAAAAPQPGPAQPVHSQTGHHPQPGPPQPRQAR
ncbi:hypothetical protein [Actinokineospora enzanensis]|uniref:hypothetical protein n=1 Tax=Actinokineospora enzanensis TaxID=155975 RepID=UPI00037E9447|nr:hypothetical protein [Actinokineospora enzanensis]